MKNATVYYHKGWSCWNKLGRVDISGKRCHQCGNWTGETIQNSRSPFLSLVWWISILKLMYSGRCDVLFLHSDWANDFESFQEIPKCECPGNLFSFGGVYFVFSNPCDAARCAHKCVAAQLSSTQFVVTQCCIIREAETPRRLAFFRIWGESRVKVLVSY